MSEWGGNLSELLDAEFYKDMMQQLRDIILVVTTEGRIIEANQAALNAYGYSAAEIRTMRVHDLRAPETRTGIEAQIKSAHQEGILFRTTHMRRNDEIFPVEVSSRQFRLTDGEAVVSVIRDISDTVAIDTALRQSERQYQIKNAELAAAYEELQASEEELRQQFDELLTREQKIQDRNMVLAMLHETALGLLHRVELYDVLMAIVYGAVNLFGTQDGLINLLEEEEGVFVRKVARGRFSKMTELIKVSEGLTGKAYAVGKITVVDDYSLWEHRLADPLFDGLHYMAAVPLKNGERIIGMLILSFPESGRSLQADELSLLQGFADIAAIALVNAQLYDSLVRSDQKLQKANEELTLSNEELVASEEELRHQYEQLSKQTEELAASERRYQSLFDNMVSGFALHEIICDESGKSVDYRFLSANPAFERLTGLNRSNIIGKTARQILRNLEPHWIETYGRVALTGKAASLFEYSQDLGSYYEVDVYCPEPGKFAVNFIDCTEKVRHQEKIEHMAYHDALTGLPNRYLFRERLQQAIAHAARSKGRVAVMMLDLDNFKLINDTLGHIVGDEMLKEMGARLLAILRPGETVARFGGDEFTILAASGRKDEPLDFLAGRIIREIKAPWRHGGKTYHMTCRLGIAVFPDDGQDSDAILQQADIALYNAKGMGKEYYQYYHPDMAAQIARRIQMEGELRKAIKEKQFVLYYQPQADFEGNLTGVEALLRWQHPDKGLIMPLDFIPIAEENGMVTEIGEWVLKTACRQAQEWQLAGLNSFSVAVNLSARQFQQPDLLQIISRELEESCLNPQRLILEITETAAMKNVDYTIRVLSALRSMGAKIALDDFGTGYSSLMYLKRFPITSLKIDRSFIKDIQSKEDGAIIVRTIVALAKSLNYTVVAEGVETGEQFAFLQNIQCDQMQGYIFSRPLPPAEVSELLSARMRK